MQWTYVEVDQDASLFEDELSRVAWGAWSSDLGLDDPESVVGLWGYGDFR